MVKDYPINHLFIYLLTDTYPVPLSFLSYDNVASVHYVPLTSVHTNYKSGELTWPYLSD